MKSLKTLLIIILLNVSLATVAMPPDMQADRYLVQVEKALKGKDKDYQKAAEYMDKIMALKDQHNLELPIEFYFKYAKLTLKSYAKLTLKSNDKRASEAFAAINHYLTTAGKSGANYAEALDLYDQSLFWQLVYAKNKSKVEQLIKLGANIHAKNEYGRRARTPLHLAAKYNNNPEVIRSLIQAGANVNAKHEDGGTPLHDAVYNQKPKTDVTKALIQAGADVNAKGAGGWTPLYFAVLYDHTDITIALIHAGADVNIKYRNGDPLLNYALGSNKADDIIRALIQAGADVNAKTKDGRWTPLYSAVYYNKNPDIIRALIQAGADVNAKTKYWYTPLHAALDHSGALETIKILVASGADVNAETEYGFTATLSERLSDWLKGSNMNEDEKAKVRRWFKNPSLLR